jgi:hypothetical protein
LPDADVSNLDPICQYGYHESIVHPSLVYKIKTSDGISKDTYSMDGGPRPLYHNVDMFGPFEVWHDVDTGISERLGG